RIHDWQIRRRAAVLPAQPGNRGGRGPSPGCARVLRRYHPQGRRTGDREAAARGRRGRAGDQHRTSVVSTLVRVCSVDDVPPESGIPGEGARNGTSRIELAIVHSNGNFYAIYDECSHAQIPLSEGDVGDGEIECYLHGSRFVLRSEEPVRRL